MLKTKNTVRNELHQDICGNTGLLLPLLIDPEFTALSDKFTAHSSAPVEFLCHAVICFVPAVETMQRKHLLLTLAPPTDPCSVQSNDLAGTVKDPGGHGQSCTLKSLCCRRAAARDCEKRFLNQRQFSQQILQIQGIQSRILASVGTHIHIA